MVSRCSVVSTGTITLYIASSVDGYIATEDGGLSWLEEFQEETDDSTDEGFEAFSPASTVSSWDRRRTNRSWDSVSGPTGTFEQVQNERVQWAGEPFELLFYRKEL